MLRIVDAKTMQGIDRQAVEQFGLTSHLLMEEAGKRLAKHVLRFVSVPLSTRVAVLAGGGKNGGDGMVCARYLARAKLRVVVYLFAEKVAPETMANLKRLAAENIPVRKCVTGVSPAVAREIEAADVAIDALMGIGLAGNPREPFAAAIRRLNSSRCKVLAADIPSGLDAGSGKPADPTVKAHYTVTFGLPKLGLLNPQAAPYVGQLAVETIRFPESLLVASRENMQYVDTRSAAAWLPVRPVDAHKKSAGRVLVIGGSELYHGAPLLAAAGALLCGAGYVSLAYPKGIDTIIRCHTREEICLPLPCSRKGMLGAGALPALLDISREQDAVVIGPGLGRSKPTLALVKEYLRRVEGPRVILVDADALFALPSTPVSQSARKKRPLLLLTPHEGEAARLLGRSSDQVKKHRFAAARLLARQTKATVVLKGRHTVIAGNNEPLFIMGSGTQALATAGSGDLLAGIIAAMIAQKCTPRTAAVVGAAIHGTAGDLACCDPLGLGATAGRIAAHLPQALERLRTWPKEVYEIKNLDSIREDQ
ncbi:NAD(P)H-hydrate dehydratase [candidate division FCPU426 bacterium]|nr:NAD(P)H-hydrate dehydratase [candidate division FCPU426 bacterium]